MDVLSNIIQMVRKKLWLMQNKAIFYCGTNGAGKSTLRSFNQDPVQIVIDSDHIAMQINPQNPRLADIEAGRKAIELFRFAIQHKIDFSMESTLSGNSILQRMKRAKENGFYVHLNYIGVNSVKINLARIKARVKAGGHFIAEDVVRNRYQMSFDNLFLILPYCDEVFIYDNSSIAPELIFQLKDNNIVQFCSFLPNWCRNILDRLLTLGFIQGK